MENESSATGDFLSDSAQGEFGSGIELSTTSFLVFGLLTFWIYTALQYHRIIKAHIESRLAHFQKSLSMMELSKENEDTLDTIIQKGFTVAERPKYLAASLFLFSMILIIACYFLNVTNQFSSIDIQTLGNAALVAVGFAALSFCVSSIYFMLWVCKTFRDHEYYELLLVKFITNPEEFKIFRPSSKFSNRWNKNQNLIAFFLVMSIPMTVSPVIAVKHFNYLINTGNPLGLIVFFWLAVLFICATIFHLWGTKILINMYNGHLRIEMLNHQHIFNSNKFMAEKTTSVLDEQPGNGAETEKSSMTPERSLAAIMLTDMVGFSAEMEHNEKNTYSKLVIHNQIIRRCVSKNNGKEIKTIGDAFLIRYKSAVAAVKTGISIQSELLEYNTGKEKADQILIRIGIHIGDLLLIDGDVLGNGVNLVARIEPLAEPGGICISADVYNVIKKSIDIKVINLGKKELKNIKDSPEIYKILLQSLQDMDG